MLKAFSYLINIFIAFLGTVFITTFYVSLGLLWILFAASFFVRLGTEGKAELLLLIGAYITASLLAMWFYYDDKQIAKRNAVSAKQSMRIPEARLHYIELMGGWPGALLAQRLFRHKTKKESFQLVFNLIIIFHITLLTGIFLIKWKFFPIIDIFLLLIVKIEIDKKGK